MKAKGLTVDLNVDIGEGFSDDEDLLEFASSVNIACGWHAGDAVTMLRVAKAAISRGVAVGAHPSFPDRENFGRLEMTLSSEEVYAGIKYQVGALAGVVTGLGGRLTHVKPHGALYNQAEKNDSLALAIAHAVREFDPSLAIFGLAGGQLVHVARQIGLLAIEEAFADRAYMPDGKLVPRSQHGAVLHSEIAVGEQAVNMIREGRVRSRDGTWIDVQAQTLCLHGDGPDAIKFARRIRSALAATDVMIAPACKSSLQEANRARDRSQFECVES